MPGTKYKPRSLRRKDDQNPRVLIITGLSGSGKTVALRAVEDLDYFCVDNLPLSLIDSLVEKIAGSRAARNVAVGIDIREKAFLSEIGGALASLRKKHRAEILFLEAEPDVIVRRFKETRRPHPLGQNLERSIQSEKENLIALRENADRIIDTSSFSPHQLRRLISSLYSRLNRREDLALSLISFGFKFGVPQNIDLLFDVRFLPNPHFVPALRPLNGTDGRVAAFVLRQPETKIFVKKVMDLLSFLLPLYVREGKSYLSIAVGCTGGNHRSPAIVEELRRLIPKAAIGLDVIHRDMS